MSDCKLCNGNFGFRKVQIAEKSQKQKYYQQGKIDGIREFVRELKKHSCSYDLEEWMNFDAVNVEVIDTLMNDCINKILNENFPLDK